MRNNLAPHPLIHVDQRTDRDNVNWTRTANRKPWSGLGGINLTDGELDARGPLVDTSYDVARRAEQMPVGTIVQYGGLLIRRRPLATGGLPWKERGGGRYEHQEIDAMVAAGATATMCDTCADGQSCTAHDEFAMDIRPSLSEGG